MRIAINEVIISGQSDGSRQRELNVLGAVGEELVSEGLDALVYAASDVTEEVVHQLESRVGGFPVKRVAIPSRPTVQRVFKGSLLWGRILKADQCDVFHTSYFPVPRIQQRVALTVNDLRYLTFPGTYSRSRLWFLRYAVPQAIARADIVLAISEFTKAEICNSYGVKPEKVIVAPIARNEAFRPIADKGRLQGVRAKYNLPDKYVLCVGHLEPRKNIPRLVAAFEEVRRRGFSDLHLVVVGKPSLRWKEIMRTALAASGAGKVRFTGYVDDEDMVGLYNLAALLVFPSLHEGFGIPLLEAMGSGLPVVTSNTTALREVAGGAAVLVDPLQVQAIADGIEAVLADGSLADECRRKGLRRVHDFDSRSVASAIVGAYKSLC